MANCSLLVKPAFPRAPLANGVGRYVQQLQRITFKFCKSHGTSRGMREFLENDLVDFAKANPGVVVYVKPRRHRTPVVVAEYLNGERHWLACKDFQRDIIGKWVETMRTQAKDGSEERLRKMQYTNFPSIQGPWTPLTFRNPLDNITKFPDPNVSADQVRKTATETLIEVYEKQKNAVISKASS